MDSVTDAFREDLLRFVEEYHWEPRATARILNRRHGTAFTAEEIKALYGQLRSHEPDPVDHLLNLENRRSPLIPDDEGWIWDDPTILI